MSRTPVQRSHKASPVPSARQEPDRSLAFGQRVRQLRHGALLTIQELSDRSGLAISTISKVENGLSSPTYENILRLSQGLDVDVSDLFREHGANQPSGRRSITRAGKGSKVLSPHYTYEMLCSDLTNKRFIPLLTTIRARDVVEFAEMSRHSGEEFFYVLSGVVTLHSEHYKPVRLKPGDSCYLASTMGHALINGADEEARILWICSSLADVALQDRDQPLVAPAKSTRRARSRTEPQEA
jgi:transcriptional regulator with XRE-family HTH domain